MRKGGRTHGMNLAPGQIVVVHHWEQGPQDVLKVSPFYASRRDGSHRYEWKFYWYLDRVIGTTQQSALKAIYDVLRHPQSWERTGVRWARTTDRSKANIVVSVIPMDTTYCGQGAAGCYCSDCENKPTAELGREYLGQRFAELVNMELCGHGTFRMHDMYTGPAHTGYQGVMGTWESAGKTDYYPTDNEIEWAKLWLVASAQYVHPH